MGDPAGEVFLERLTWPEIEAAIQLWHADGRRLRRLPRTQPLARGKA